mmetsp:Transcript_25495/g.4232  ORF Transcript_25495/g.4232 Transcript_25495/m.4232 type:complete len:115 (+) Transcript_25495:513-857(+)|eukprot:CAMPEP_0168315932 /NCGR_PEP_ID=MMETSP0210-20121227/13336_1 /TAXON_ID=40633 /ORGANISM="Condylostoma magnum, Strain COL2" /LENGTH=114 /DNA_ID=CAMNT_0008292785 /DNA_START=1122 /DNA_END=1466 /DNA_ORIENTATION=+
MVDKVKRIAKNPITASEDKSKTVYDLQSEQTGCFGKCSGDKGDNNAEYETELLENTIVKIGTLLALGFGEAGAAIIGTNIEQGGDVDPMLEGKKMMAVFGFCYVLGFADTTDIL